MASNNFDSNTTVNHIIYFTPYAKRNETTRDNGVEKSDSANDYAVIMELDGGAYYCADNS